MAVVKKSASVSDHMVAVHVFIQTPPSYKV